MANGLEARMGADTVAIISVNDGPYNRMTLDLAHELAAQPAAAVRGAMNVVAGSEDRDLVNY